MDDQVLTVAQAASLMGASENTVYSWLKDGRVDHVTRDGVKMIALSNLRRAKVLRQVDVIDRLQRERVAEKDIAEAIAQGAAKPSSAPDARFSLEDCDGIVGLKTGTWKPPTQALATTIEPAPVVRVEKVAPLERDEFLVRAGRWDALFDYLANHKEPAQLPPTFWDTRDCPEFIPPAGVFRFTYWHEERVPSDNPFDRPTWFTWIRRSDGFILRDGKLYAAPEDEEFAKSMRFGAHAMEAPSYALQNAQYRTLRLAWEEAWYLRRRQLRRNGIDPLELPSAAPAARRNRIQLLEKYHREEWGPTDLPDWFWDTEECPPFEPPNGIARYEFGRQGPHPLHGHLVTFIRRTASYNWDGNNHVWFEAGNERYDWEDDVWEMGTIPLRFEHLTREYDAAKQEWLEEWRRRTRRRRGD